MYVNAKRNKKSLVPPDSIWSVKKGTTGLNVSFLVLWIWISLINLSKLTFVIIKNLGLRGSDHFWSNLIFLEVVYHLATIKGSGGGQLFRTIKFKCTRPEVHPKEAELCSVRCSMGCNFISIKSKRVLNQGWHVGKTSCKFYLWEFRKLLDLVSSRNNG